MEPIRLLRWCGLATLATLAFWGQTKPAQVDTAPATFRVKFETSKGDFVVEVKKDWAPVGADRFYLLVKRGFFDNARFFRVVRGFVVQFGINGDPKVQSLWSTAVIPDDRVKGSNKKGSLTFAMRGRNTRTTQIFINLADNVSLDGQGFAPFGLVVEGMPVVERLYSSYGDMPPRGNGPDPQQIQTRGNAYLEQRFPRLDYIIKAHVLPAGQ
jgi:peptidyl-prolyl cis-trans isomerase A (cyclophilin A)